LEVDPRLAAALRPGPVLGHLTSATLLAPGATFRADGVVALHTDAEVFVELGAGGTIAGYGAALELCDLGPPDGAEAIVASNVFHRAEDVGERLRAGDRIITGSVVQVPLGPADQVSADFGAPGLVGARLS
jgi:2-keto-4-pentenoate hydratase